MTGSSPNPDSRPVPSAPPTRDHPGPAQSAWKDEIAARVRARRNSRTPANQPTLPGMEEAAQSPDSVAARVAARYSRLPSWREMLNAQASAPSTVDSRAAAARPPVRKPETQQFLIHPEPPPPEPAEPAAQPDMLRYSVSLDSLPERRFTPSQAHPRVAPPVEAAPYPVNPLEDAVVEPSHPLPATLITTPRELVAPRKARPRLAEGPLCDEPSSFEPNPKRAAVTFVHGQPFMPNSLPESLAARAPEPESAPGPPQPSPLWHSIQLDTEAPIRERRQSPLTDESTLDVAPLEDRAAAALVDCALTLCAFLLFAGVFALSSTSLPHGRIALIGAASTLFAMGLLYQLLFFTVTDATPGMRYAKIALCTFADENPSRPRLRGRIAALLLSALPLGLGFLWAIFDENSLGWHDRITRTYQRSYRDI